MARLDFVVSRSLSIPLSAARQKIVGRCVEVQDVTSARRQQVITAPSWQVVLGVEQVFVDGQPLRPIFHRLLLMHKPRGCVCTRATGKQKKKAASTESIAAGTNARMRTKPIEDGGGAAAQETAKTVFDWIPSELQHPEIGPFGRLDKDTTGLLLLGSDGGLQTMLTDPTCCVGKVYLATLRPGFAVARDAAERVAAGLELPDGTRCKPATLSIECAGPPMVVRVTLQEGFNHQVKRMLGALGGFVDKLHRLSFGPLSLATEGPSVALAEGEVRPLTRAELVALAALLPQDR
jgi:pseudouridine synthase